MGDTRKIKEIYGCKPIVFPEPLYPLQEWHNLLIEKTVDEITVADVARMLRQNELVDLALSKAIDFLKQCITPQEVEKYKCTGVTLNYLGTNAVNFDRYVEGYRTEDMISVFVNDDGSIRGYNGRNACKFIQMSTKFTKNDLDEATQKLTEKIESLDIPDYTLSEPYLVINHSGELFIQIVIRYVDTSSQAESLYIRVN